MHTVGAKFKHMLCCNRFIRLIGLKFYSYIAGERYRESLGVTKWRRPGVLIAYMCHNDTPRCFADYA
jgi:hypothetical protein